MSSRKPDYDAIRRRTEESCVVTYEPEKCYSGYTLFSNYRGNTFYLMDMEGHIVHTWQVRTAKVAELLPNGHLMYGHMWKVYRCLPQSDAPCRRGDGFRVEWAPGRDGCGVSQPR